MDTCIQMPEELGLKLQATSGSGNLMEMGVSVWAKRDLKPGLVWSDKEGMMRLERLEVFSLLDRQDVRYSFGCVEEVCEVEGRPVRHCNWVRFLRSSRDPCQVNVLAKVIGSTATFEVIRPIAPMQELIAFFQPRDHCEKVLMHLKDLKPVGEELKKSLNSLTQNLSIKDEEKNECSEGDDDETENENLKASPTRIPAASFEHSQTNTLDKCDRSKNHSIENRCKNSNINFNDYRNNSNKQHHSFLLRRPSPLKLSWSSSGYASLIEHSDQPEIQAFTQDAQLNHQPLDLRHRQAYAGDGVRVDDGEGERDDSALNEHDRKVEDENSDVEVDVEYTDSDSLSKQLSPIKHPSPLPHCHSLTPKSSQCSPQKHSTPLPGLASEPLTLAAPLQDCMRQRRIRGKGKSWLHCDVCHKRFDRPSLLTRHLRIHTGEKPYGCEVCGKAFSTSSSLNTHKRIHSGERPHKCPVCDKRFTASSNLYYHRMTHKKDKPHKCTTCSKSFPTPGDLRTHQYTHTGAWPYVCHVCERGFSKQANLKNHLLVHYGVAAVVKNGMGEEVDHKNNEFIKSKNENNNKTNNNNDEIANKKMKKQDNNEVNKHEESFRGNHKEDMKEKRENGGDGAKNGKDSVCEDVAKACKQKSSLFSIDFLVSTTESETNRLNQRGRHGYFPNPTSFSHFPPHHSAPFQPFHQHFLHSQYGLFSNQPPFNTPYNAPFHHNNHNANRPQNSVSFSSNLYNIKTEK